MDIEEHKPFRQVGPIEYEIQIDGRTKTVRIPFALTEEIFKVFINSGGIIDPVTGQVQQDILQLISSFKEIGNLLLSEWNEEGQKIKDGTCGNLCAEDVVALFQLASHVIEAFIKTLVQIKAPQNQPEQGRKSGTKTE